MSFGRPGGFGDTFKVSPPQRGSFPLDHDGDCRDFMLKHLKCLKEAQGDVGKCRLESRRYLECRMDNNLMIRDDMANLGLGDVGTNNPVRPQPLSPAEERHQPTTTTASSTSPPASGLSGSERI